MTSTGTSRHKAKYRRKTTSRFGIRSRSTSPTRIEAGSIRITWTKEHATEEDISSGHTTEEEKSRNRGADELATRGIAKNEVDGVMVKAAKQRRSIVALQQTMLVNMSPHRQELRALDEHDQQQLDEEAAAIADLEVEFAQHQPAAGDQETQEHLHEGGRRSWSYVKAKLLTYMWDSGDGINEFKLKVDPMPRCRTTSRRA